jgi:hypothetical protein
VPFLRPYLDPDCRKGRLEATASRASRKPVHMPRRRCPPCRLADIGVERRRALTAIMFRLAWISTEPDRPNKGTAKGFIGLMIFPLGVMQDGALMEIFASRTCRTAAQDTGAANMGASARTSYATVTFLAVGASNANAFVDAYTPRENGEVVYQRTEAHNNSPPQVTLPTRFGGVCR